MHRRAFLSNLAAITAGTALTGLPACSFGGPTLPPRLKPGDRVAVVAPAGAVFNDWAVEPFANLLKGYGLRPVVSEAVAWRYGYLAGDDELRAAELNRYLADPDIRGVIAMRGGWGCARILHLVDYAALRRDPKVVMGYSDITALLNAVYAKTGLVTFHGPMGYSDWDGYTQASFLSVVFRGERHVVEPLGPTRTVSGGRASGPLVGGNLTVLSQMAGSEYQPDFRGAVLFLEEIGEEVYRIDRMLTQLSLVGALDQISGAVFGICQNCEAEDPDRSLDLADVLSHHFARRRVPTFSGAPFGHVSPMATLPVGASATIDADAGALWLDAPAVS